jgi:flagellar basal body-associated protein FliL
MADEEKQDRGAPAADGEASKSSGSKSLLPWILLGVIVPLCAGAGFGLGRLMAGAETVVEEVPEETEVPDYVNLMSQENADQKSWFFQELEPVVANLADPGATRYIRAGFMLEMAGSFDSASGAEWLREKKPLIKNWLAIYLASQSVEDLQGERNLNRVLAEIRDLLNERLFPNVKPPIAKVLLSEFAIQ